MSNSIKRLTQSWEPTEQEKIDRSRLRIYGVGLDQLTKIFNGEVRITGVDLPPDARVVGVNHDFLRCALSLAIHSMNFDPVPLGQQCPFESMVEIEVIEKMTDGKSGSFVGSWRDRKDQL